MARIPLQEVPTVEPIQGGPGSYQRIEASPASFGGATAAATQRLGGQLDQVAGNTEQIALIRQHRFNQVASDDAFNKLQEGYLHIAYGNPNNPEQKGYYALHGEEAVRQYQPTLKSMEDLRTQIHSGLANDAQRLEFGRAARRLQTFTTETVGRHYDNQFNTYSVAVNRATEANQIRQIGSQWNDDQAYEASLQETRRAAVRNAQVLYGDNPSPEIITAAINKATSDAVTARVTAWGANDPVGALGWLKKHETEVDPAHYLQLEGHFKAQAANRAVNGAIERSFGPEGGSVGPIWERIKGAEAGIGPNGEVRISPAGAIGRSQIMPDTAREMAADLGVPYDEAKLRDPKQQDYNEMLGRGYYAKMLAKYDGNTTLATAAYNAGPRRVDEWTQQIGDPRTGQVSDAAFMARIPIAETRAYVQKVLGTAQNGVVPVQGGKPIPPRLIDDIATMQRAYQESASMEPEQRERVLSGVYMRIQRMNTLVNQAEVAQKKERTEASTAAHDEYVPKIMTDPSGVSVEAIANDNRLDGAAKWNLQQMLNTSLRNEPKIAAVSHGTATNLIADMRRPEGDPARMSDLGPVYRAYQDGKLSNSDFTFVQAQFKELQTDEGQRLDRTVAEFLRAVKPSIEKSNPLQGALDMTGGTLFFELQQHLQNRIAQYRKEGKNPYDLLDPAKPDYIGKPEALAPYQKSVAETMAEFSEHLRRVTTPAPAATSKPQSLPPAQRHELSPQAPADEGGAWVDGQFVPNSRLPFQGAPTAPTAPAPRESMEELAK